MVHVALLCLLLSQSVSTGDAYPDPAVFAAEVRRALPRGLDVQEEFAYLERRREVEISVFGSVTVGPVRTFEVTPTEEPGGVRKRLIAVDGRSLGADELARREAEHQQQRRRAAERRRRESPSQRSARLQKDEEGRREREAMLDDAVAVFEPSFAGRNEMDGHPVWIVDLKPRQAARVQTREGKWMRNFEGRIWVSRADYQIVKLEMQAVRDVTVGWGVIGRIDRGSRVRYVRRHVGGAWLPAELTYEATGRTLLVRPFEVVASTTYSDYQRVR